MRLYYPIVLLALVTNGGHLLAADRFMMQLELNGQRIEGTPLLATPEGVSLLARDGHLWNFKPSQAENYRQTSAQFRPYSAGEMRGLLERELGKEYEVSGTRNFLVAHPRGQRNQWAERFQELYNSFVHYFSVRGFQIRQPEFPLVAVVWKRKEDFLKKAIQEGTRLPGDVLGYYSPQTNRISMYDLATGKNNNSRAWQENALTIVHEATHQTAFNTGIHSRFTNYPRWVSEGLATMFEAPGVWDSRSFPRQEDRINRALLKDFRDSNSRRKEGWSAELISSDRPFQRDSRAAYAEAWALTFFLVETQPREYARYLTRTAQRTNFEPYGSAQRMADFTALFGDNFRMLEARFLRFIESLK